MAVLGKEFSQSGTLRANVFIAIVASIALITTDIIARAIASAAEIAAAKETPIANPHKVSIAREGPDAEGWAIAARTRAAGVQWLVAVENGDAQAPTWIDSSRIKVLS